VPEPAVLGVLRPDGPTPVGPIVAELLLRSELPPPWRLCWAADGPRGTTLLPEGRADPGAVSERPGVMPGSRLEGDVALVPPPPGVPPLLPPVLLPEPVCASAAQETPVTSANAVKVFNMMLLSS
jgi:hypothetical protein